MAAQSDEAKLPVKKRHPLDTGCPLFPIHTWLYFLYIVLAIILPVFGTLLIICAREDRTKGSHFMDVPDSSSPIKMNSITGASLLMLSMGVSLAVDMVD